MILDDIKSYDLILQTEKNKINYEKLKTRDKRDFWIRMSKYEEYSDVIPTEERFKDVLRLKRSRSGKRRRANKKITAIPLYLRSNMVFVTCTLNDKELSLKEATIIKHLNKWIHSHFTYAVINRDYGEKNERLHFHFIGVLKENEELEQVESRSKKGYRMYELTNKDYKLGFEPTIEKIQQDGPTRRVSNYLLKINNHSNKDTTKNHRFIVLGKPDPIDYPIN